MNKALDDHDIANGHAGTRRRDWRKAKAWLAAALTEPSAEAPPD